MKQTTKINTREPLSALMTITDVSAWLGVKEKTVRQWIYQDRIPSLKINGIVRFSYNALTVWSERLSRGQ